MQINIIIYGYQVFSWHLTGKKECIYTHAIQEYAVYIKLYRKSNMQLRMNSTALIGNKSVSKYRN